MPIASQIKGITTERKRDREELKKHHNRFGGLVLEWTRDLQQALDGLKKAQTGLIQTGKPASLGQLAAGIAHEINTPSQFRESRLSFASRCTMRPLKRAFTGAREIFSSRGRKPCLAHTA